VAVTPAQIVGELTVVTGSGLTVTVATAVDVHPKVVPVTVYDVLAAGATLIGFETAPVDQTYVVAPAAVNVAASPGQIVGELTVVTGRGLTVTVAIAVDVHPKEVPVTVYDVVVAGVTLIGFVTAPVDQAYVVAPAAVNVAVVPAQIVGELTVVTGSGLRVTVATAEEEHPKEVPVTVYDVVAAGVTLIGFVIAPVDQAYVAAPAAVNVAGAPGQIVGELTVVTGIGLTVIV